MATVAQALAQARALGVDRLDAQLILAWQLGRSRSWVIAHDDDALDARQAAAIHTAFARRVAGEPLAYLLGEKEFHGLLLKVDANVLVPRPDTELLVDWALERLAGIAMPRVVDLGTGSGAIALAVKHARTDATVLATDASLSALDVARANAQRLALDVTFAQGSWWFALGDECFDLILSNPPYIAGGDPHLAALTHEPTLALTPGGDGLGALREIIGGAAAHMTDGAWLLLEHGYDQADAAHDLLRERGFTEIETRRDLGGQPRCTGARR
ncbi:MAG: peptide chain release factor N(5)-glutamine methyltransferase [Burkholderiales bacterium]